MGNNSHMSNNDYLSNLRNQYFNYKSLILDNPRYQKVINKKPTSNKFYSNKNILEPKPKRNGNYYYIKTNENDIGFYS